MLQYKKFFQVKKYKNLLRIQQFQRVYTKTYHNQYINFHFVFHRYDVTSVRFTQNQIKISGDIHHANPLPK